MDLDAADTRARLEAFLRSAIGADAVHIRTLSRMSGGAMQENWALDADVTGGTQPGPHQWVLRTDAAARVEASLKRSEEFQILAGRARRQSARAAAAVAVQRPRCHRPRVLHHATAARRCERTSRHARSRTDPGPRAACVRARRKSRAPAHRPAAATEARVPADDARARQHRALPQLSRPAARRASRARMGTALVRNQRAAPTRKPLSSTATIAPAITSCTKAGSPACSTGSSPRSAIRSKTSAGYSRSAGASPAKRCPPAASPQPDDFLVPYAARIRAHRNAGGARILAGHGAHPLVYHCPATGAAPPVGRRAVARTRPHRPHRRRA